MTRKEHRREGHRGQPCPLFSFYPPFCDARENQREEEGQERHEERRGSS